MSEVINNILVKKILTVGDININIPKNHNDWLKIEYLNLMAQMGFVICINKFIRVNYNNCSCF
jgi:hypothetical protein